MKFVAVCIYAALIVNVLLLSAVNAAPFYEKAIQDGLKNMFESVGKYSGFDNWFDSFQGMMQDGMEILEEQESPSKMVGKVIKLLQEVMKTGESE